MRPSTARILYVTDCPPHPTDSGGAQRSNLIFRALRSCGEVDLLLVHQPERIGREWSPRLGEEFGLINAPVPWPRGRHWPWRIVRWTHPEFVDKCAWIFGSARVEYSPDPEVSAALERQLSTQHYDVIVGRYLQATASSGALSYSPVVVDVDDLDTEVYRLRMRGPGYTWRERLAFGNHYRKLRRILPDYLGRCQRLWASSEADRQRMGTDRARVLPNIPFHAAVESGPPRLSAPDSSTILFVGSLDYHVNSRAIDWFVEHVWPTVHAACPAARFRVVGSNMSSDQRTRWSATDGVEPVGFVEDLEEEYAKAAFTIAPFSDGGGTKIKVVESLYHGRTSVVTPHVGHAFAPVLRHRDTLWVAGEDDFGRGCIALLENQALREELARRGQQLVVQRYSFDSFRRVVESTLEEVLPLGPVRSVGATGGAA